MSSPWHVGWADQGFRLAEHWRQYKVLTHFFLCSQVGKTTLVRSLVRRYTKNTMADIKGPVTVVTGTSSCLRNLELIN